MMNLINTSSSKEIGESVPFHKVLMAYPTCHSWIITAHVSLVHLECHWKNFNRQMDKTCQLLQLLNLQPSTPTQLINALQVELSNIDHIYNSYKPAIISAINLMNTDASFDGHTNQNTHLKRSLLPFLGDTLRWLTGTYAAQVNRHSINILMDRMDETSWEVSNLYNFTPSLATSLSYHQLILYIRSVLANLWDSLFYLRMVSTHTMDYIDAATTGTLSTHFTNNGSRENVIIHRRNLTIYITSASLTRGHTTFL